MESEIYAAIVDLIEKQNYCGLVTLLNSRNSADFLRIHAFDLLETLIYAFLDNKDKFLIRCLKILNNFVSPKERLLTYLTTIEHISSLTLCIHFAKNLCNDIEFLSPKCVADVRTQLLPKLYAQLVQFTIESGGDMNPDSTIMTIFLRIITRLYVLCDSNDKQIRNGFITDVLMRRAFRENPLIRIQLNRLLRFLCYEPQCHDGLWLPCSLEMVPYFILNECADDERTGLLPSVYHPAYLLRIIVKPVSNYITDNWDDPVYLKNVFMSASYVGRMVNPMSIRKELMNDFKPLFVALLKTNGTFRLSTDNFTTMEVFALLMENMEPVCQYTLICQLTRMVYEGSLSVVYTPHTLASLVDFYRRCLRHDIPQYAVFRKEIGNFYHQLSKMQFNSIDMTYMYAVAICVLVQSHALARFNDGALKFARKTVIRALYMCVHEYDLMTEAQRTEAVDGHNIPSRIELVKFELSEVENRINEWLNT